MLPYRAKYQDRTTPLGKKRQWAKWGDDRKPRHGASVSRGNHALVFLPYGVTPRHSGMSPLKDNTVLGSSTKGVALPWYFALKITLP